MFGHDISNLMMGTFSGNERDEFGKEKDARLPLLLPKVMEGRPIVSTSPLFGLPAEIIGDIIDLIANDPASLAALALVNSDCRQLARSCQFADVCFDYSINSGLLLMRLLDEARVRSGGDVSQPAFIGPCVRRVTVRPRDSCVARLNRDLYESIWGDGARDISHEQRAELREKATAQYFTIFRNPILAALAHAMPNLEALSWCDPMCLDDTFLRMVTRLPIRHLMLLRVNIAEPYRLEPPLAPPALPLESLTLSPRICGDERHRDSAGDDAAWEARSISPFAATLLQLCSGTLLRLVFSSLAFSMEKSVSFGPEPIVFSRLRHLNLSGLHTRLDAVAWSSLLSAPLTHLSLCWGNSDPTFIQALSTCQPFRDLDTLVVQTLAAKEPANAQAVIDFISRHPHTRKLSVGCSEPHLVDTYLLPALSDGRWSNLTSLSLAWDGPGMDEATAPNIATIAAESLAAIGSITSLEQLCLSAGVSAGWRHQCRQQFVLFIPLCACLGSRFAHETRVCSRLCPPSPLKRRLLRIS